MAVEAFMAACLGDPRDGYYIRRDPLGVAGDFITGPEISQMFGELIGLWCAEMWRRMDRPRPFPLVELGPGRGTLASDAVRAIGQAMPDCARALDLHLVETSPALRERQRQALGARPVTWHDALATVPEGPILVIANEFFDALPIRQFQRTADGWHERLVDTATDGGFQFVAGAPLAAPPAAAPRVLARARPGDVIEVCDAGRRLIGDIADRLGRHGGGALVIDYGYPDGGPGETLQAVKAHRRHDPLHDPGEADLTAHVDFAALAAAAGDGVSVHGPVHQRTWLRRLGIDRRLADLTARAREADRAGLVAGYRRLTDGDQMGTLFKALALGAKGLDAPPGFDADAGDF